MAKIDYSKIFIENACPTSIGGQAVMEGVMMQGPDRIALAMRLPSGELYLKTKRKPTDPPLTKVPMIRGVVSFVRSLTTGMKTLMESADILEAYAPEVYAEEESKFESWLNDKFGQKAAWNIMMTGALIIAFIITVVGFVIFPTWVVNFLSKWISNAIVLNLIEGILRIILFVLYVLAIRRMEDIKTLFRYHGAEHKSIHCFENNLELTVDNAEQFYTLHPRCGTSFLVFVLIVSLLLFSFLGWPNLLWRILSRLLLIPVIAGISYELLKWAGRSNGAIVKILSYPGLMLQKLTTEEPTREQLEVALLSLKAVLVERSTPVMQGIVDSDGNLIDQFNESEFLEEENEEKKGLQEIKEEIKDFFKEEEPIDLSRKSNDIELSVTPIEAATEAAAAAAGVGAAAATIAASGKHEQSEPALANCVSDVLKWGQDRLAEIENGRFDATQLFSYLTGMSTSRIITRAKAALDEQTISDFRKLIEERLGGKPMQYITGTQSFMGLNFKVNPNVLIPRLDTEVLADKTMNIIGNKKWEAPEILDMCTGSGALGIAIADRYKNATVTMTDASAEALNVAIGNAQLNNVNKRCIFLLGDMFEALPEGKTFECIVCNPPYIESAVIDTLSTEVKDHEPRMALDGGADGLDFYREIAAKAGSFLKKGGILALEIGADQDAVVKALLKASGDYAAIIGFKDLAGLDRVVIAEKK